MFEQLRASLKKIGALRVEIYAKGRYPLKRGGGTFYKDGKKGVWVQQVAKWQNDGTERIRPAHFVEAATLHHGNWQKEFTDMIRDVMLDAQRGSYSLEPIKRLGQKMAADISDACNRIDTGRLKRSFTYRILRK